MNYIKVIILLASLALIDCGKCPAEEYSHLIHPCVCNQSDDTILCKSDQDFNLRVIFDYMTQTIDWKVRNFKRLVVIAPEVTQLEETTFYEINFEEIFILNAKKLERIHGNAFGKTRTYLKKLFIEEADQLTTTPEYNLFDALSSMHSIHEIVINGLNVQQMPEYALRPLLGQQWNLTYVTLRGNIEKVGNYVHYDPAYWIKKISLGNQIKSIASHAFDFRTTSHMPMTIDLSNNLLTADSFESGVFLNAKRVLNLNLSNNKITHFDEFIFEPFLDLSVMNQIDIKDNALICDCRMKWLLRKRANFEKQVVNAVCVDGRSLWSLTMDDINECKITDVIVESE